MIDGIHGLCSEADFSKYIRNNHALFIDRTLREPIWDSSTEFPKPRYLKSLEEKKERTKRKAEVFTPVKIVKEMVDLIEDGIGEGKICLEITCGEAPYVSTRYHTDTGEFIPVMERVGFLDRKLAANPHIDDSRRWLDYSLQSLKESYGYEYQIDSLSIARLNILMSVIERFRSLFPEEEIPSKWIDAASEIISWNFFRMDGLTDCIPGTDKFVLIKDWKEGKIITFESCKRKEEK